MASQLFSSLFKRRSEVKSNVDAPADASQFAAITTQAGPTEVKGRASTVPLDHILPNANFPSDVVLQYLDQTGFRNLGWSSKLANKLCWDASQMRTASFGPVVQNAATSSYRPLQSTCVAATGQLTTMTHATALRTTNATAAMPMTYSTVPTLTASSALAINSNCVSYPPVTISAQVFKKLENGTITNEEIDMIMGRTMVVPHPISSQLKPLHSSSPATTLTPAPLTTVVPTTTPSLAGTPTRVEKFTMATATNPTLLTTAAPARTPPRVEKFTMAATTIPAPSTTSTRIPTLQLEKVSTMAKTDDAPGKKKKKTSKKKVKISEKKAYVCC